MCCPGQGRPQRVKRPSGRVSHQKISPIKGQIVIYRTDLRPDLCWYALCAGIVGNRGEPSGESRLKGFVDDLKVAVEQLDVFQVYIGMPARR